MACVREVKSHLRYQKSLLGEACPVGGLGSVGPGPVVPKGPWVSWSPLSPAAARPFSQG